MVLKKFTLITHYTFHRLDIPQGDRVVGLGASWPSALYAVVQRRSFSLQSNFVKQKKSLQSLCVSRRHGIRSYTAYLKMDLWEYLNSMNGRCHEEILPHRLLRSRNCMSNRPDKCEVRDELIGRLIVS